MDDINLKKVEDIDLPQLPRNIHLLKIGDKFLFVKKHLGRLEPVSKEDQEKFTTLFINVT